MQLIFYLDVTKKIEGLMDAPSQLFLKVIW